MRSRAAALRSAAMSKGSTLIPLIRTRTSQAQPSGMTPVFSRSSGFNPSFMCLVMDGWQGRTTTRSKDWVSTPVLYLFLDFACHEGALSDSNGWMCKPGSPQWLQGGLLDTLITPVAH